MAHVVMDLVKTWLSEERRLRMARIASVRRWLRRLALPLFLFLIASPGGSQTIQQGNYVGVVDFDLDSTTLTYCRGAESPIQGRFNIKTTGSSTTVVAANAGETPFDAVAVGDLIWAAGLRRQVATKTDGANITVDTAINLDQAGGWPWSYIAFTCGTTASDGWMPIYRGQMTTIVFELNQVNVTGGIDVRWECRESVTDAQPVQVFPASGFNNYTAAGIASRTAVVVEEPWQECRVGVKINSADDGGDTGANAEKISVYETWKKGN